MQEAKIDEVSMATDPVLIWGKSAALAWIGARLRSARVPDSRVLNRARWQREGANPLAEIASALGCERFGIIRELAFCDGGTIDHRDDAVDGDAGADRRPVEGLDQRLRQSEARSFDQDMLRRVFAVQQLFERRHEIIRHRAADAAIGQFHDVVFRAGIRAAAFPVAETLGKAVQLMVSATE